MPASPVIGGSPLDFGTQMAGPPSDVRRIFDAMHALSAADYEGVLDLVVDVARARSLQTPLPPSALDHIGRLIPTADTVAYWFGRPDAHRHALEVAGTYRPWTRAEDRLLDRLGFQDPLLPAPATIGRARRLSDALALDAYRATDFYRRLGRRHGLDFSIATWIQLPNGEIRGLWLDSTRADFDDHDLAVLDLVGRQLQRLAGGVRHRAVEYGRSAPLRLTERQAEILALAAVGRSNDEIARDLSISSNTVRTHLENTFDRLDVHTRAAAVARAWELGILPRTPRRLV
jgi:DNA-binding CsgD family transcriptional regulator